MTTFIAKAKQVGQLIGCWWLLCAAVPVVVAENTTPATVFRVNGGTDGAWTNQVGLSGWLTVEVTNLSAQEQMVAGRDKSKLVLFLDDTPLKGLCTDVFLATNTGRAMLRFHLQRTDTTRSDWAALLGRPHHFSKIVQVSVGFGDSLKLPVADGGSNEITFVVIHERRFWACLTVCVLLAVGVWLLGRYSEAVRDDGPLPPDGKLRPYSLARWQMAFWFVLVVPGFLFLWIVTGAHDTLTQSILVLMGVSASTAVFAHAQNAGKQSRGPLGELQNRRQMLLAKSSLAWDEQEELEKIGERIKSLAKVSVNFIQDVLTDDVGMSFHRFQMFVWTIVLGLIYLAEVYQNLAMPDFSDTLLGLMGISSGTYLGFMLTEKPTTKGGS